jgi:hypothetical protein
MSCTRETSDGGTAHQRAVYVERHHRIRERRVLMRERWRCGQASGQLAGWCREALKLAIRRSSSAASSRSFHSGDVGSAFPPGEEPANQAETEQRPDREPLERPVAVVRIEPKPSSSQSGRAIVTTGSNAAAAATPSSKPTSARRAGGKAPPFGRYRTPTPPCIRRDVWCQGTPSGGMDAWRAVSSCGRPAECGGPARRRCCRRGRVRPRAE